MVLWELVPSLNWVHSKEEDGRGHFLSTYYVSDTSVCFTGSSQKASVQHGYHNASSNDEAAEARKDPSHTGRVEELNPVL